MIRIFTRLTSFLIFFSFLTVNGTPVISSGTGHIRSVAPDDPETPPITWSDGSAEHYFPTTTGKYHIIDALPEIDPASPGTYTIEIEILADGYWPGQTGFIYGVAGFPLTDASFHELGKADNEWGFRARSGEVIAEGVPSTFGSALRYVGDRIKMEYHTTTGTLNFYTKRVGATDYDLEGGRAAFTGISPAEGQKLRFVVSGVVWQPGGIRIISASLPNQAPTDIALSATAIDENSAANSTVGSFTTTDPNVGNTFTYSLVSGEGDTDNDAFTISEDALVIKASSNYESKSSYSVRVRTTDQGGLYFEKELTITVNDVEEIPTLVNGILYVKKGEAGNGSGWEDAVGELADALITAGTMNTAAAGTVKEIWVGAGTYIPKYKIADLDQSHVATHDRDKSFLLIPGIKLYGGFAGNETSIAQRDIEANQTILSGDLLNDDAHSDVDPNEDKDYTDSWYNQEWAEDNAYHVLVAAGNMDGGLVDGFTITDGNAAYDGTGSGITVNGMNIYRRSGGGIESSNTGEFKLANNEFLGNRAISTGGGLMAINGTITMENCRFESNISGQGGAYYRLFGTSVINDSKFINNYAIGESGGAIYHQNVTTTLTNSVFENNFSAKSGGAMLSYFFNDDRKVEIKDSRFQGNRASDSGSGGAISFSGGTDNTVENCEFIENSAPAGGGVSIYDAHITVNRTTFLRNEASSTGGAAFRITGPWGTPEAEEAKHPLLKISNSLIAGNRSTAGNGGIIFTGVSRLIMVNNTIADNSSTGTTGGIFPDKSELTLYNNIFWNNTRIGGGNLDLYNGDEATVITAKHNIFEVYDTGNSADNNTSGTDPLFSEAGTGDYSVQPGSVAVNKGDPNLYASTFGKLNEAFDLSGNKRVKFSGIDIGALESSHSSVLATDGILYVSSSAADGGDGSGWDKPLKDLGAALAEATDLSQDAGVENDVSKIYVAEGTYYPSFSIDGSGSSASFSFIIPKDVQLLGGFPSTGMPVLEDRNWNSHPTILNGDVGAEDELTDNSWHVLIGAGDLGTASVDGFVVTSGHAMGNTLVKVNDIVIKADHGAGIYLGETSVPLRNLAIQNSKARNGGGMYIIGGNVSADHIIFQNNTASQSNGGGAYVETGGLALSNTVFDSNTAGVYGGGFSDNTADISIINAIFKDNQASVGGGGISSSGSASHLVFNSVFLNNSVEDEGSAFGGGGAFFLFGSTSQVQNSIFRGNMAGGDATVVKAGIGYPDFPGTSIDVTYSMTQNDVEGTGNFVGTESPFNDAANPAGTDGIYGSEDDGLILKEGSEAINAGDQTALGEDFSHVSTDITGRARVVNEEIDLGPYEWQLKKQDITIANIEDGKLTATYGDADINPASATSGSTIVYSMEENSIAEISSGKIRITGTGEIVVTASVAGNTEYQGASKAFTLAVSRKSITASVLPVTKTYDGTTAATLSFNDLDSDAGLVGTDEVEVTYTSAVYDTKDVGTGKAIAVTGLALSGADKDNYSLSTFSTTGVVTALDIEGSFTADNKVYDGTTDATVLTRKITPLDADKDDLALSGGTASFADVNAETGKTVTAADMSLTGTAAANYNLTGVSDATADISPLDIEGSFTAENKSYDGNTNAAILTRVVTPLPADSDNLELTGGTAIFEDADAGTDKIVTASGMSLTGTAADNYNLTGVSASSADITTKAVTVTAADKNKTYGDTDPALTYTFTPELITGDSFTGNLARETGEDKGTYAIEQGTLALSSNYALTYTEADLTIDAKELTVTADVKNKTYGDTDPALTYTFAPELITGDSFTGNLARETGEDKGTYAIKQGTLVLSDNYILTYAGADLTINPKAVTVTADTKSKTYGDADPVLTYTSSPALIGTDDFSGELSRTGGEDVGTYAINQGTLALSNNYALTYAGADLTISPKAVTVTADLKSKTYGDSDPALTYTFAPELITGDSFTGNLARETGEGVGAYAVDQGTLALSNNYALTYAGADLIINPKAVTVTADAKSKTYGDADPVLTYTFSPALVGTDDFGGELGRTGGEDVSTYAINQGTLALSNNYALTYAGADLIINPKAVTVTADARSKTYGDADPVLTYTSSPALVGTDDFSGELSRTGGEDVGTYAINQGTLALSNNYALTYAGADLIINPKAVTVTADAKSKTYGDADPELMYTSSPALVGTDDFSGELNRGDGEDVGTYAINQGTLALSNNYALTYAGADLTINPKAVTVIADAKSKTYGDADPVLTYTSSPALIGTDDFSGELNRADGEDAGAYVINQGTLALNGNYSLAYANADFTINPKAVTVTADAKRKTYGDTDPVLTYRFTPDLHAGDSFTGSLIREAGEGKGAYAIERGTLSLGSNYTLSYASAGLTIDAKAITITADAKSKTYGDTDPALTFTLSKALIGDDSFNGELSRVSGEGAGTYHINQGTLSLSNNYTLSYQKADFRINRKILTITAEDKTRFAGIPNPDFTIIYDGFISGDDLSVLTRKPTIATTAGITSAAGNYPLIVSGAIAENYQPVYHNGTLTIVAGAPENITFASTTLYENAPAGALAGTLSSSSNDSSMSFTYSLVSGNGSADNSLFAISGNEIRIAANLDFEQRSVYSIRVRSTNQNNLSADQELIITLSDVNEEPTLTGIADQVICYTTSGQKINLSGISAGPETGQSTTLIVNTTNNALFANLEISEATDGNAELNYTIAPGASGSAVINILVTDDGGTANGGKNMIIRSFKLSVNPLSVVSISSDIGVILSKGETAVLTVTGDGTYEWQNAQGIISGQNRAALTVRPEATTTYKVSVTNSAGCTSEQAITLTVNADYVVVKGTNIVSPNGDGVNDNFIIDNIDMYPKNEVKIYDRAGRMLYSQVNYTDQWNGTLNGSPLADGTYYYVVEFGPSITPKRGFITIVRD